MVSVSILDYSNISYNIDFNFMIIPYVIYMYSIRIHCIHIIQCILIIRYSYNPTLTYGQAKDSPRPIVQPHFILFDGKCLLFNGFTKQIMVESPTDEYRIRRVKITYFLVDDTISVVEPVMEVKTQIFYKLSKVLFFLNFKIFIDYYKFLFFINVTRLALQRLLFSKLIKKKLFL